MPVNVTVIKGIATGHGLCLPALPCPLWLPAPGRPTVPPWALYFLVRFDASHSHKTSETQWACRRRAVQAHIPAVHLS